MVVVDTAEGVDADDDGGGHVEDMDMDIELLRLRGIIRGFKIVIL